MAVGIALVVSGPLCVASYVAGRRFAISAVFQELNTLASRNQADDEEMLAHLKKEVPTVDGYANQIYIQNLISSMENRPSGFICLDDTTKNLFTPAQRMILEKSLKSYFAQVYWGKGNIPIKHFDANGEPINGFVLGYSIKVYPGIVKISTSSWSGILSGGGHTDIYIWKGLGFRFYKQSQMWIS
ncbi:hypothetical protein [Geothrix terrae]|uniref:hypothetical protein n=1 Tax=Geothrix terrae TaxID=2922720 RepID=UPI001FAB3775|nr:hypothetical protein [Geothrix terrae]